MENILVAGATGTTGKQIINLLENNQYFTPVAMVRKEGQKKSFSSRGIKTVMGDLMEDLSDITKNIDKVIFAAGSGGKNVERVDRDGAVKLINDAQKNNIKKFVMLSSMGADQPDQKDELQDYLKAKQQADEHLKNSSLRYSIVRPGSLTNDHATDKIKLDHSIDSLGEIPRADVAQVLVRSLHDDVANNATFEIIKGEKMITQALETIQEH